MFQALFFDTLGEISSKACPTMEENKFDITRNESLIIVRIEGYFNEELGKRLEQEILLLLNSAGGERVILDMSACVLVNSPGVSYLFDLSIKVSEDFIGWIGFCNLTPFLHDVLSLAGILAIAEEGTTLEDAISTAKAWVPST